MTVRVRGIYTTALTSLLSDVVQASPSIQDRFDEEFPVEPATATATTTSDRQGVCVTGTPERVGEIVNQLEEIGLDTFVWRDHLPRGAVFTGEVVETLGGGALIKCDTPDTDDELDKYPRAGETNGFLPYSKTDRHLDEGDTLRVQVDELRPPWADGRHVLETTVSIRGELGSLVRGHTSTGTQPELAEILPTDPPDGWGMNWSQDGDDADLDALGDCLDALSGRATDLEAVLNDAENARGETPHCYWSGEATCWVWFGRESRFALDDIRRDVVPTMHGHHRTKAATSAASTAVDFVEALCDDLVSPDGEQAFPFGVVTDQFGPREGESLHISHGKPDGRLFDLGAGEVTKRTDEEVTLKRTLSGGGTYDALGVEKQAGDVAITKFKEGRWWYPTVYRGEDGETRGTYVNICTPVEVFPDEIRYIDLHVDVIKHTDGTVERVDDDELDEAVEAGYVSGDLASKARTVAEAVSNAF